MEEAAGVALVATTVCPFKKCAAWLYCCARAVWDSLRAWETCKQDESDVFPKPVHRKFDHVRT